MPELLEHADREFLHLRDGRRLSYLVWGDPAGPVLLLLHGGTGCAADWWHVAAAFDDAWRVVAPDQRGCGHSDWDEEARYGVEPLLEDVAELLAALRIEQTVVVGHSLGAAAALVLAARRPELVRALVLEDGGPKDGSPRPAVLEQEIPERFASREETLTFLAGSGFGGRGAPWLLETRFVAEPDGSFRWRGDMAGARRWAAAGGEPLFLRLWPEVERLRCPTLFVRGADSPLVPLELPTRMMERNPVVRGVEIPDAGHGVHFDQPDAFVAALREFLGAL